MLAAFILAAIQAVAAPAQPLDAPPAQEIARDVYLLPGRVPEDRGPDGNTIIFRTHHGLIVVDTGRHVEHSNAILTFAADQRRPIVAIVNTHWHLDHSSGNRRIKAVYPDAPLYTTNAIDHALTTFLARSFDRARERDAAHEGSPAEQAERALFLDTMAHPESLRPDVAITRSGRVRIGAKSFAAHVTDHAVSEADLWLYDSASRVAVVGDLVTLPAPFFETACPHEWSEALDEIWATPFRTAVPGHGPVMSRDQFALYRAQFNAFMACVNSERPAHECSAGWADGVAPLMADDPATRAQAPAYADYYVDFLRQNGGKSPDCALPS